MYKVFTMYKVYTILKVNTIRYTMYRVSATYKVSPGIQKMVYKSLKKQNMYSNALKWFTE
jgi:hypothetical protein